MKNDSVKNRKKIVLITIVASLVVITAITVFYGWDTYRIPGQKDEINLPVWIGSLMKVFDPNIMTKHEVDVEAKAKIIEIIDALKKKRESIDPIYFRSIDDHIKFFEHCLDSINERLSVKED